MIDLVDGSLRIADAPFDHRLAVAWRIDGRWRPLPLRGEGDAFVSDGDGPRVRLSFGCAL